MANWRDIVPKGFDLAPRDEHPLNVHLPNHQLWDSGVQKRLAREPFKAFNPTKDPILPSSFRSEGGPGNEGGRTRVEHSKYVRMGANCCV